MHKPQQEDYDMMRAGLFLFLMLLITNAYAQTVINYDDGSTLTLTDGEAVYVQKGKVYQYRSYQNGKTVQFKVIPPTKRRDYVPQPTDGMAEGSHEWCKAYIPWSEGFTFAMQTWIRHCDTNNDNKYGCGDEKYDASDDGNACPS